MRERERERERESLQHETLQMREINRNSISK